MNQSVCFFCLRVNPCLSVRMTEQPLFAWALKGGGFKYHLFVRHSSVCQLQFFCLPVCSPRYLSVRRSHIVIHNECSCFFIVFLCDSHLRQKNPQPVSLSQRLSGLFPACFTLCMKTANYGARLARRLAFRAGPSDGNLSWIWIMSQMSSWINMAIYFKLQVESNCTLCCLLCLPHPGLILQL